MKAAQQHSKNLLFGFFFSFVFFVRGRHDMLAPRLPSFHDGSILSENFYYFFCFFLRLKQTLVVHAISLSLISFYPSESPCIVASFLSPFPSNHGLFWWNLKRLSASVGAEWRHPTAAKADLPFWPPVVTSAIWHLRIFRSTRHTLKSRWYNSITTFIARKDEGGNGQNEKAEISCSFVCRMHFDLSYCRVLWNRGLKYEKRKKKRERWVGGKRRAYQLLRSLRDQTPFWCRACVPDFQTHAQAVSGVFCLLGLASSRTNNRGSARRRS